VRSAIETSRPLIDEQGHQFTVELPPMPILLDADPTRLAQVFSNLLNNAAKYSEQGGHITLSAGAEGNAVIVRVTDRGIGIPADHLPRIFQLFAQVETASDRSQGGLGIGLSLVRGLVEMHGGTIEANSEGPGRGSELIVRLPRANAEPLSESHAAEPDGAKTSPTPKYRILVVDDNQLSARSTAIALGLMGHDLATARDGIEGIERARTFQPDVILMDIGLPEMNGHETARRMRQQPGGKNIILIAVTGYGQEADRRRSLEAGFDYHLVKPLNFAELKDKLSELCADPDKRRNSSRYGRIIESSS
jgi:CheY-like chemotaxis protein